MWREHIRQPFPMFNLIFRLRPTSLRRRSKCWEWRCRLNSAHCYLSQTASWVSVVSV